MVYRAIGLMSGSSLDGLDIAFTEFQEEAGQWKYEIKKTACISYSEQWKNRLRDAVKLTALDYQQLDADYGHYLGQQVNQFIETHQLHYQVALISSHGHTTFHVPAKKMTAQLGEGAPIAALTGLPVVTDLRALDLALGGQGAPIVPIGEKLLLGKYEYFLNLGGIANISHTDPQQYIAFDVCPANRVLNMLVNEMNLPFDDKGQIASTGNVNSSLLEQLNRLDYYRQPYPKSLANDFGINDVFPIIRDAGIDLKDALRTFVEHIVEQIRIAVLLITTGKTAAGQQQMLATGGGALNDFLVNELKNSLAKLNIKVIVPDEQLINFKEALIMAFIGVLRWRQEYNVLSSVTGASRNSIGGAIWTGEEA